MSYVLCAIGQSFPVQLALSIEGKIAFVKAHASFPVIFDQNSKAKFDSDGFEIDGYDFQYNVFYNYKEIPEMLQWLVAQNLISPLMNKE